MPTVFFWLKLTLSSQASTNHFDLSHLPLSNTRCSKASMETQPATAREKVEIAHIDDISDHGSRSRMTTSRYVATRLSTLKPTYTKVQNPVKLLTTLNTQQWMFFLVTDLLILYPFTANNSKVSFLGW